MKKKTDKADADVRANLTSLLADTNREKRFTASVKKSPTDGSGRFTAIVSTFGPPPDVQGDVVAPGAFLRSIMDWLTRGRKPSIWWDHSYDNPAAALGTIERMFETEEGLVIEGALDLDHEPAVKVYEGLLSGRLSEFSIGFAIIEAHKESSVEFGHYQVLDELELLEVSVVHAGANRYTRLVDVKSTTTGSNATVTFMATPEPEWRRELKSINDRLDALSEGRRPRDADAVVDAFVTAVRLEMVEEKLAEAERAVWERSQVNVIDPVPVRVDARMRPVSSEDGSPSV
jgi:HK97 family phage prohead protease